jgi:hypothetical protein
MVELEQASTAKHRRQLNNRVIAIPLRYYRWGELLEARQLPERMLEHFTKWLNRKGIPTNRSL